MDKISDFIKGSFIILLGTLIGVAASFLTKFLAARYLGATEYGALAIAISILEIATILALAGLPEGLAREIPRSGEPGKVFTPALIAGFVISGVVSLLVLVISSTSIFFSGGNNRQILLIFAGAIPFLVTTKLSTGGFRGKRNTIYRIFSLNISYQLWLLVLISLAVISNSGLKFIALSWLCATITSALVSVYLAQREELITLAGDYASLLDLFKFSTPLLVSGLMWVLFHHIDNLLIGMFHPEKLVGIYDAAFTLCKVIFIIKATMDYLFMPIASDLDLNNNNHDLSFLYSFTAKWSTAITYPVFLTLIIYPEKLLTSIFGPTFLVDQVTVIVLAIGFFLHILFGMNENTLIAGGHTRLIVYGNTVALILNFVLNVLLIPTVGITGAALASAVSYCSVNIIFTNKINDIFGIRTFNGRRTVSIVFLLLIPVLWVIYSTIGAATPLNITVQLITSSLISLIITLYFTNTSEEVEFIKPYLPEQLRQYV